METAKRTMALLAVVMMAMAVAGAAAARAPEQVIDDGPEASRPSYIECQDSAECQPGECCVLGGNRFSIPSCQAMHMQGEPCRLRGQKPFNTSVGYPDGAYVDLTNVYWLFCPCADGLFCQRESSSCQTDGIDVRLMPTPLDNRN